MLAGLTCRRNTRKLVLSVLRGMRPTRRLFPANGQRQRLSNSPLLGFPASLPKTVLLHHTTTVCKMLYALNDVCIKRRSFPYSTLRTCNQVRWQNSKLPLCNGREEPNILPTLSSRWPRQTELFAFSSRFVGRRARGAVAGGGEEGRKERGREGERATRQFATITS